MSNYVVERRDTGEVVYAYGADVAVEWPQYPFAEFNHILQKDVVVIHERNVTKLEYLRRFTQAERIAIRAAATNSPELADYLAMLDLAQDINLDDLDTIAALAMLEAVGLLAAGRAAEIVA